MEPLNGLFWIVTAAFLLLLAVISMLVKDKDQKTRENVLVGMCLVTIVGFFIYKYFLSIDPDYDELNAFMGGFNWWGELPLHLCNINMLLIPVAVKKRNVPLMSFSFFAAPLGALMAILMPGSRFSGVSLLLPRMLGYFGTHYMVMIEGMALAAFCLYKPCFKELPRTILTVLCVGFTIFLIDELLRITGLYARANYFYMIETEQNFLLEIFHKWIPYPFLYTMPALGILIPYMLIVTAPFEIAAKIRKKNED